MSKKRFKKSAKLLGNALNQAILEQCAGEPDVYTWHRNNPMKANALIRQFLEGFALHVITHVPADKSAEWGDPIDCIEHIPDLTQWPDSYTKL